MDKFNDYDKLLASYTQLEKEFTKKCQQLAELKKSSGTNEHSSPQQTADEFFRDYPDAEKFRGQILQRASAPGSDGDGAFAKAYFDLLRENYVSPEALADDEDFLQRHVINSEKFADVLQKIGGSVGAPTIISGKCGQSVATLPNRPRTLKEASELAKDYFKN